MTIRFCFTVTVSKKTHSEVILKSLLLCSKLVRHKCTVNHTKSFTEVSVTDSQCACTFKQLIVCTVLCPKEMKWWSPIVLSTGNCCPPVYEMCDHTPEGSVHPAGTHSNRCCIHLHWPERKQRAQSDYYPPMIKLSKCVTVFVTGINKSISKYVIILFS